MKTIVQLDAVECETAQACEPVSASPMFLQTLLVGIIQPSHKNIRFYWLEFLTTCLPYLTTTQTMIVGPVLQCLCDLVDTFGQSIYDSISVKDLRLLLKTTDLILKFCTARITESEMIMSTKL